MSIVSCSTVCLQPYTYGRAIHLNLRNKPKTFCARRIRGWPDKTQANPRSMLNGGSNLQEDQSQWGMVGVVFNHTKVRYIRRNNLRRGWIAKTAFKRKDTNPATNRQSFLLPAISRIVHQANWKALMIRPCQFACSTNDSTDHRQIMRMNFDAYKVEEE